MHTLRIRTWILLAMVSAEFVFIACNWLSYCPPIAAAKFVFSGAWFKGEFHIDNAGLALDQPTIGKFFLWTAVMSCLACTIILLLRVVVDANRPSVRCWVNVGTTALLALVLIELLAPTFLLIQYVVSMGVTIHRLLGLSLCCAFWVLLPCVILCSWRAHSTMETFVGNPLSWALACSFVVPIYYLRFMWHPSAWRYWDTMSTVLVVALMLPVLQGLYGLWLMAYLSRSSNEFTKPSPGPYGSPEAGSPSGHA